MLHVGTMSRPHDGKAQWFVFDDNGNTLEKGFWSKRAAQWFAYTKMFPRAARMPAAGGTGTVQLGAPVSGYSRALRGARRVKVAA